MESTNPLNMSKDTIAAIATASGAGGIGIVRVSGSAAKATLVRKASASMDGPLGGVGQTHFLPTVVRCHSAALLRLHERQAWGKI